MMKLPADCVSRILSVTSPKDACRMMAVSREFRVPAESNVVWDKFLPTDCLHIVSSISSTPMKSSSKKELFHLLCDSILIDGGYKAFALEKSSGRKCCIISARRLSILHSDDARSNWTWKSIQESRFPEVAELITADRLEIQGKIRFKELSPNTNYGAYLLFKIRNNAFGLDSIPCETSIRSGNRVLSSNTALLRNPDLKKLELLEGLFYRNRMQMMKKRVNKSDEMTARKRGDEWLEIEIGEFFVGDDDEIIEMSLMEVKGYHLKGGLIVQGIEVRPKE